MAQVLDTLPDDDHPLRRTPERDANLNRWLTTEVEDALSARSPQDRLWDECLRQYEAVPKRAVRDTPIDNAPNVEVSLGAMTTDAIYAQGLDLIYQISPVLTVRATNAEWTAHAKALQTFVNHGASGPWRMRPASEQSLFDDVQLGTGIYYIPWTKTIRKTATTEVRDCGPRIYSVPPEDFIVPGGADFDLQALPWVGVRYWLTEGELELRRKHNKWRTQGSIPVGNVGWVRGQRERLARTSNRSAISYLYETMDLYCHFDYDQDGLDEDILVSWDRTSRTLYNIAWNPFDRRPLEAMRYQLRPHLFSGIGVMEMCRPYQEELTELHNHIMLNILLANSRMWATKPGVLPEGAKMWPSKVVECANPGEDIKDLQLGEVYPSAFQMQSLIVSLAEKRCGLNSATTSPAALGGRTPGITALSVLQAANRRFVPAFDGMRFATAGAVRQCLWRFQERLLAGDEDASRLLSEVLSAGDAQLVEDILRSPRFDDAVAVELTASSVSVNREADRQNGAMFMDRLGAYYEKVLGLVVGASNPQTPPVVAKASIEVLRKSNEAMDMFIRTFEQVRDPENFIVDLTQELEEAGAAAAQQVQQQQMLAQVAQLGAQALQQQQVAQPDGGEQVAPDSGAVL